MRKIFISLAVTGLILMLASCTGGNDKDSTTDSNQTENTHESTVASAEISSTASEGVPSEEASSDEAASVAEATTAASSGNSRPAPDLSGFSEGSVVSVEAVDDCDGSGHGYYAITLSDGSVVYQEY